MSFQLIPNILNLVFPVEQKTTHTQSLNSEAIPNGDLSKKKDTSQRIHPRNILSLIFSAAVFILFWVYIQYQSSNYVATVIACFTIGSLLASVACWENFSRQTSTTLANLTDSAAKMSTIRNLFITYQQKDRERETCLVAFFKIVATFFIVLIMYGHQDTAQTLFALQKEQKLTMLTITVLLQSDAYVSFGCSIKSACVMATLCIIFSFMFYKLSQHACRVLLQRRVFAPVMCAVTVLTPWTLLLLLGTPNTWTSQDCNVLQPLWQLSTKNASMENIGIPVLIYISGILALALLTWHIWQSSGLKLVKPIR